MGPVSESPGSIVNETQQGLTRGCEVVGVGDVVSPL
jgi:hypothetical protein